LVITDCMNQHVSIRFHDIGKLFLFSTIFIIVVCIFSLMIQHVIAQRYNNESQESDYLQELPINITDKSTILVLLASLIKDKISNIVDVLEISSKDESLMGVPFIENVTDEYNGISSSLDLDKRNLGKDILQRNKDLASIFFVLPNGDIYMGEPFSDQEQLPRINFADREWYKGVLKSNQTYISSIFMSASINAPALAIAVPIYSSISELGNQTLSSTLNGYWVGIIDLHSLQDIFESLSLQTKDQFVLIDHNGTELLDTKKYNLKLLNVTSFKKEPISRSISETTQQANLETFEHFDTIKGVLSDPKTPYNSVNLDDRMWMIWDSIKIKNSVWYVVLITRV
jgi:Cache domain